VVGPGFDADVFIIGGGPAGLAAAIAASKKGFQVTVADGAKPPIEKPCGEGMLPDALSALEELGVVFERNEGHPFPGISFVHNDAQVSANFPERSGLGLRRPILHERLIRRAQECGIQLLWESPVSAIDGDSVKLSSRSVRAKWIVGADGNGSRVRRWSGLETSMLAALRYASRRHYRVKPWSSFMQVYWGLQTQAYITPMGTEEVCVVAMSETREHACFERVLSELPELRARLAGAELSSRERGAATAMRSLRRVQRGNIALLGDASGGVDAITGEGLRLAFRQAFALADAIAAGDLTQYERAHRALARRPRMMGQLMLWLGRNARIRGRAIRAMQSNPELFARILATHAGQTSSANLLSTGAMLGWQVLAA
jgi:flavin-dependent dehydrogenase